MYVWVWLCCVTIAANKHINDKEYIYAIILIFVFFMLLRPSLNEEDVPGVNKNKYMRRLFWSMCTFKTSFLVYVLLKMTIFILCSFNHDFNTTIHSLNFLKYRHKFTLNDFIIISKFGKYRSNGSFFKSIKTKTNVLKSIKTKMNKYLK